MVSRNRNLVFLLVLIIIILSSTPPSLSAQTDGETEATLRAVADAVIKSATFQFVDQKRDQRYQSLNQAPSDVQLRPESPYTDWRYWNGVLNIAMMKLGEVLGEPSYTEFARKNIDFGFDSYGYFKDKHKGESKWEYPFGQFFIMEELDDCGAMGASVIEMFRRDPQPRYREYIDRAALHITAEQTRLDDRTFVRSFPHRWTLWVDDLYMSLSFLTRFADLPGKPASAGPIDDAIRQVINFHRYLFNDQMGLMYHCWYSDVRRPGVAFWGRGNGWAMLAQVDLLDHLPSDHQQRDTLLSLLRRHIVGVARYQSAEGLWHQLLDKVDSYLETSCTAMFTYAIARAVNKGYIEPRYASIARRGWEGIMTKIRPDGQVEGVCAGTGVSDDLVHYYRRPTPLNDVHGIGAVLLAGTEVLQLQK